MSIVLLVWLVLMQALLVVHRVDHSVRQHGDVCVLCLAADHSTGPPSEPGFLALEGAKVEVPTPAVVAAPVVTVLHYRSRAPPTLRFAS